MGISGSATFIQSGGTNNLANGSLGIGGGTGSSATYSLDGGQILANNELVSGVGTAIFSQSGGINTVTEDQLALGGNTGNAGSYYLSGSGQMSINFELVGEYGTGTFTQSGGTNGCNSCYLGYVAGSSGTYSLSGSGLLSTAMREYVGLYGTGTFLQSAGTNSIGTYGIYIGSNSVSNCTYNLSGNGLLSAPSEYVGFQGRVRGLLTQFGVEPTILAYSHLDFLAASSGNGIQLHPGYLFGSSGIRWGEAQVKVAVAQ